MVEQYSSTDFLDIFNDIVSLLKHFLIMDEKYYPIVSLWIMGTYFHKSFRTYPYLYLNASKGSGKTRLLKLIAYLSHNGNVIGLPSEAFMFREAETHTFCLDEMENINTKESTELRLLLNSAYKKGLFVPRMKKVKEEQVTQMFESFSPICIANIWGLDDVLQDRCITLVLEKINKSPITKKTEAWETEEVKDLKQKLLKMTDISFITLWGSVVQCSVITVFNNIEKVWNDTMDNIINNTTLLHTLQQQHNTTPNYTNNIEEFDQGFATLDWLSGKYYFEPSEDMLRFYHQLYKSDIDGRNLELFFPLLMMAALVSEELCLEIIDTATTEVQERNIEEIMENRDALTIFALYNLVNDRSKEGVPEHSGWIKMGQIKEYLMELVGEEREMKDGSVRKVPPKWLDVRWLGKSVKRARVTTYKRRLSSGIEIQVDEKKVAEKARLSGVIDLHFCSKCHKETENKLTDLVIGKEFYLCQKCAEGSK